MAAQFMATYALPVLEKYKPAVNASYTYVSGDKNSIMNNNNDAIKSAKIYKAWDPMFEGQGGGTIYNALFPLTNLNIIAIGASASPLQDVTAAFTWSNLIAADRYGAQNPLYLYEPNATTPTLMNASANYPGLDSKARRELGNESDINISYAYTEDVSFGLSLGWFVPGDVFASVNRDTASQAIVDVRVAF
jgi:hypothetical protein